MRLLQRKDNDSFALTHNFVKEEEVPMYAVLSHTWGDENEEVTFDDVMGGKAQRKTIGYEKIRFCSEQAVKDGLQYFWVDTCCINKSSSQELQETITTMYQWYRKATRCYVYLTDVSVSEDEVGDSVPSPPWEAVFRSSRWFTRGWTLQELLAPTSVRFYSVQGTRLGDKTSLQRQIHRATGIPHEALQGEPLTNFTVAKRLSWAKNRQTTRKEDEAYCLLGIFAIFMPLMYGEGDHAFIRLQEEIDKMYVGKVKPDSLAEKFNLDHLLDTLPTTTLAAFNSLDNQHGSTCLPNTRVELLREIREWVDGSDERCIYWLNGIAGTGKSTIARTIARTYYDQGNLGGTFFFSKGGGDAAHADKLFTTLASQLANHITSARRHVCEAIMKNKGISQHSFRDQWEQLIINPLSKLDSDSYPSVIVLVLDALDECDNERDIRIILRLLAMTRALRGNRLRIFITSRPEIPIRCGFQQIPESERQGFALHDIAPTLVDRDLTLFFEDNLTNIREERGFPIDWPGRRVISRLVEISCGLFIWASTACRYIREGKQLAKKRIAKLMNGHRSDAGPEKQLDQIYITVLKDSIRQDYDDEEKEELYESLREVLGSIVTLLSPLPMNSLANLLDIEVEFVNETLADMHTIFNIPSQKNRAIHLHHPTFRDFLLDKERCRNLDFQIDENEAHKALGESCVRLMSKMLKQNICGLQSPGARIEDIAHSLIELRIPLELQYACLYWAEHYRRSGTHLRDHDVVHCFFQEHFLHWLEAISLMGKGSEMAAIIRMYQSLLLPAKNTSQLPFVKDSRRFMFAFQSRIEQTPLQIYCAALAFIRPSNQLRHHFWSQLHAPLKQVRIAEAIAPVVKDEYNYVNDLAFTPDGREVASGSTDEWVRVWDVATKAPLCKFEGQMDKVSSVAISPDGTLLASGSDDATVMVWNMKSNVIRYKLTGHTRWVNTVTFSPDGKLLASGSMDETIRLWVAESGKEVSILEANSSCVNSIAFSPDGSLIASGTVDQLIRLWDLKKVEIRTMLDGHSGPVNSVRFSPNEKRIASGSDDMTIKLWDADTGTEIMTLRGHLKKVWAVTFSQDTRLIASGSEDKTIRLWNANTGDLMETLTGHTSGINAVIYSPDCRFLASGSFNDEVRLWDAKTGETRGKLADFSDDDKFDSCLVTRLTASGLDEKLQSQFSDSGTIMNQVLKGHSSTVICLVFSPDGRSVASGSHDSTIKLWSKEGAELWKLTGHSDSINHLAFSPSTNLLASASMDKTAKLWDATSGSVLHTFEGHAGAVRVVRFSFDSRLLASCSVDKTIRLWDTVTGAALSKLKGHSDTVNNIAFSPDNRLIASCSADMTICLWDVSSATQLSEPLIAHTESINSVSFSSDGKLLLSCSSDRTIRTWDTAGAAHGIIVGHTLSVNSATFSQDMKRVVSSSDDGTVRIWDLETKSAQDIQEVGVIVRNVSFSSCGRYLETDRGLLTIDSSPTDSLSLPLLPTHALFITNDWLRRGKEDVLWLPDDYHATSVASWNEVIVLGHSSGAVSFIKF